MASASCSPASSAAVTQTGSPSGSANSMLTTSPRSASRSACFPVRVRAEEWDKTPGNFEANASRIRTRTSRSLSASASTWTAPSPCCATTPGPANQHLTDVARTFVNGATADSRPRRGAISLPASDPWFPGVDCLTGPEHLIPRSVPRVRPGRCNPESQVSILADVLRIRHSPVLSGQSARKP